MGALGLRGLWVRLRSEAGNKEGWTEDDGGCLRLYTDGGGEEAPAGAAPSYVDVEPKAGTLVVFRSDLVPHEVLDTTAPRVVDARRSIRGC